MRPGYARRPASLVAALGVEFNWRADQAIVDGSDNVIGVRNLRGSDTLTIGVGSAALGPLVIDPAFNNQPVIEFTGTQWLDSDAGKAAFNYLNKSNVQICHVFSVANTASNKAIASTGFGSNGVHFMASNAAIQAMVYSGAGQVVSDGINGLLVPGVAYVQETRLKKGMPFEFTHVCNSRSQVTASLGTLSVAPAQYTLRIGNAAQVNTVYHPMIGRWAETMIIPRVMGDYETQMLRDYFFEQYGILTEPPLDETSMNILRLEPQTWTRADRATVVGTVTAWRDLAMVGHLISQATTSRQVPAPTVDAAINNRLSTPWTASLAPSYTSTLTAAQWAFAYNGNGMEVWTVFTPTSFATAQALLMIGGAAAQRFQWGIDATTGVLRAQVTTATPADVVNSAGPALALNQPVFVGFYFKAGRAGNEYAHYVKGAIVDSGNGALPPSAVAAGLGYLGGNSGAGGLSMKARYMETIVFNRVLPDNERAALIDYFSTYYGIAP